MQRSKRTSSRNQCEPSSVQHAFPVAGAVVALILLTSACGSGGSDNTPSQSATGSAPTAAPPSVTASSQPSESGTTGAVAGGWDGTWTSTSSPGAAGTFHIDFTESGDQLKGSITITDTPCITEGTITGTLSGQSITFGAVKGDQTIAYTGTISGDSMAGTYAAPQCDNGKGTWRASKS